MCKCFLMMLCLISLIVSGCNKTETTSEVLQFDNAYFYIGDVTYLSADVTTNNIIAYENGESNEPRKTERTSLSVHKISDLQNGHIYKLAIQPVENLDGYLTEARLNLYFYVTSDEIHRIWSYIYEDDILREFYDDDELLIQILDTEEKIISNSYIVCQQKDLPDSLGDKEAGTHSRIEISGTQIESAMWNVTPNGETDFYESFVWKSGKGLTSYRSGFRSESNILHLNNISLTLA